MPQQEKHYSCLFGVGVLTGFVALATLPTPLAAQQATAESPVQVAVSGEKAKAEIIALRAARHPGRTRLVLEISHPVYYHITPEPHPQTVEIIVNNVLSRDDLDLLTRKVRAIGLIERIDFDHKTDSLILKLTFAKSATIAHSFLLKPDHGRSYRLVFDLEEAAAQTPKPVTAPPIPPAHTNVTSTESPVHNAATSPLVVSAPVSHTPAVSDKTVVFDDSGNDSESGYGYDFHLSGYIETEGRVFSQSAFDSRQKDWTVSFALEPLFEYISDTGNSQFIFRPFGRLDVQDSQRSHFDIRELKWVGTMDRWQLTLGINTVFWGVTESSHLVNILNQNDNLEDIDQEDKLGQPMAALSYDSAIGVFSAYLMTYFRESRYPGTAGRLRPSLPIDLSLTQYDANADRWHRDWAVRWSHVLGNFDFGLYHFKGTSREAMLTIGQDSSNQPVLIPRYKLIDQTGLDIQATFEDLLFKFETIRRVGFGPTYWAMTGGFEYTLYGLFGGDSDIGLLGEYLYDDRGADATTSFESDLFAGMRWAANDIDGTEILVGAIFDMDNSAKFVNLEGSRRIGDNWKITLDARFSLSIPETDITYSQSRDDFIQLRLARYF